MAYNYGNAIIFLFNTKLFFLDSLLNTTDL